MVTFAQHYIRYALVIVSRPDDLEQIAAAKEVTIETRSSDRVYGTVIWIAADDDALYVRSFRGESGKWYQRARSDPRVDLIVGDTRVALRAVLAIDTHSVKRASDGFRRKYPKGRSLDGMLVSNVLHTTLRLEPVT